MKGRKLIDNSAMVLENIFRLGNATQIQLVKETHLRRTSIFNIFEALKESGLVETGNTLFAQKGRPCILWELGSSAGHFLVVYLNNGISYFALYDFAGNLVSLDQKNSFSSMEKALEYLESLIASLSQEVRLCGVILTLSGVINPENGVVIKSRRWDLNNFNLKAELERLVANITPLPITIVENNARLSAWGEKNNGSCLGIESFLTLHIERGDRVERQLPLGLGSGMVLDGKLYKGHRGTSGELDISHYKWCKEFSAKGTYPTSLGELDEDGISFIGDRLGESFSHLVNYLSPQRMVLVFDNEDPSEIFISSFRESLRKNLIIPNPDNFPIELSSLGSNAVIEGGSHLLREAYFSHSPQLIQHIAEYIAS